MQRPHCDRAIPFDYVFMVGLLLPDIGDLAPFNGLPVESHKRWWLKSELFIWGTILFAGYLGNSRIVLNHYDAATQVLPPNT